VSQLGPIGVAPAADATAKPENSPSKSPSPISSVKARYGDEYVAKVGDLVSEAITLSVPEPALASLLALCLLGGLRRRQR